MKHQQAPALSCLERGRILAQVSPGETPKHLRYQPRGRNTAGTSVPRSTGLLGPAPEHLQRLHRERSTAGTTPGHHPRSPDPCPGARPAPGAGPGPERPGRDRAERPRLAREKPRGLRTGKRLIPAAPGTAGKAAPALGACFKSQMASGAGARPPRREQCAAARPPPPAPPGLGEGRGSPSGSSAPRLSGGRSPAGPGAAGKAEKTRVEIIRSDLFPWSDSSFEQLPNGSFCLSESFSSRFCSD